MLNAFVIIIITDPRGVQTVTRAWQAGGADVTETASAVVTNRVTRYFGGAVMEEKYWDGRWTRETRSSDLDTAGCRVETVIAESSDYSAFTNSITVYDFLGRAVSVTTPLGITSNFYSGASDRLVRVSRTGQPDTLYEYETGSAGVPARTVLDVDGDGQVSYSGPDRISATDTRYEEDASNVWWRVTSQSESVGGLTNSAAVVKEQVTGLSPALQSCVVTVDAAGVVTTENVSFDPLTHVTTLTKINSLRAAPNIQLSKYGRTLETRLSNGQSEIAYDGLSRVAAQVDSTTGGFTNSVLTVVYDALGLAVSNRAAYGPDVAVSVTGYDDQGRAVSKTDALSNTVETTYDSTGNVTAEWGATYPVAYAYDTSGRTVAMRTFRVASAGIPTDEGGDLTRWLYDNATGLLTNKVYADTSRVRYAYTPSGRLATRIWARGLTTTYSYDTLGQLVNVDYPETQYDVFHAYDVFGYATASSNSFAQYTFLNKLSGTATNETAVIGTNVFVLNRSLDGHNRGESTHLTIGDGKLGETRFALDAEGRVSLVTVTNATDVGSQTFYGYDAGYSSGWETPLGNGGTFRRIVLRDPFRSGLVACVSNTVDGATVSAFGYGHDLMGKRSWQEDCDGYATATNAFLYSAPGEVTNAVLGAYACAYDFDNIGNRVWTVEGAVTNTYTANQLNQYDAFTYDADGNMLSSGNLSYLWDAENRLRMAAPVSSTNGTERVLSRYDHRNRRVLKRVEILTGAEYVPPPSPPGNPGEWVEVRSTAFVWDNDRIAAEVISYTNGVVTTNAYFWGVDMSGTVDGAAGVGGLIRASLNGFDVLYCYDAHGNVTELIDAYSGAVVAKYRYGVFGETVRAEGPLAAANPWRFATRYHDDETGLVMFPRRPYSPELGRFLLRDPIEEDGGLNLYGIGENDLINAIDCRGESKLEFDAGKISYVDKVIMTLGGYAYGLTEIVKGKPPFPSHCACDRKTKRWRVNLTLVMQLKTTIVGKKARNEKGIPRSPAGIAKTENHEALHRKHMKAIYDALISGYQLDKTWPSFGSCQIELERTKIRMETLFHIRYEADANHVGPAWKKFFDENGGPGSIW